MPTRPYPTQPYPTQPSAKVQRRKLTYNKGLQRVTEITHFTNFLQRAEMLQMFAGFTLTESIYFQMFKFGL